MNVPVGSDYIWSDKSQAYAYVYYLSLDRSSENLWDACGSAYVMLMSDNLNKFLNAIDPRLLERIEALADEVLATSGCALTPPQPYTRLSAYGIRAAQFAMPLICCGSSITKGESWAQSILLPLFCGYVELIFISLQK